MTAEGWSAEVEIEKLMAGHLPMPVSMDKVEAGKKMVTLMLLMKPALLDYGCRAHAAGVKEGREERYRTKNGRLIHDGDCHFWARNICTCGLLHDLSLGMPDAAWFHEEMALHEAAIRAEKGD